MGEIGLDLTVDRKGFDREMNGVQNLAKKAAKALAGAFAVKKLVDFGKSCIELGSDLDEVQNVVDVTFPRMTSQVDQFAKSAATSFGLSETMAKKFTGTFGAMAKAFGFSEKAAYDMGTTLTGLAGDVASFYNISQDEAYTKLKSVFTGETETLKDLGIVMTQNALDAYAMANGYGKVTAKMSEAEKVALRYAFVQDQLTAATGDFARTSDSWANQVRIMKLQFDSLKASIGQGLINVFSPVLKVINVVLGKIATLANAFKAFTELLTGKKASKGTGAAAAGMNDIASSADTAGAGLGAAGNQADKTKKKATGAGKAAKKAAKDIGSLGIDELNVLNKGDDNGDNGNSGSGNKGSGGGAAAGEAVDYGNLAEGEAQLDKLDPKWQRLIDRVKELAGLFKQGFVLGLGDTEGRLESLRQSLKTIKQRLLDIVTDKQVVASFNQLLNSLALAAGKFAGSCVSIGLTIATNLVGGIAKYLEQNTEYIKARLVNMFNAQSRILDLFGDLCVNIADIFSVFANGDGQQITADIIGVFSNAFLGVGELVSRTAANLVGLIAGPINDNKDKIKAAVENTLKPISKVTTAIREFVTDTFAKISEVYDKYIDPAFKKMSHGLSTVFSYVLNAYNKYLAPVLDWIAERFGVVKDKYIQPFVDAVLELWGALTDAVATFWDFISPFVGWFVEKFIAVFASKLQWLWTKFEFVFGLISTIVTGVIKVFKGVIEFVQGVFTGNWGKAWDGIKSIFGGSWDTIKGIVGAAIDFVKNIIDTGLTFIKNIASVIWSAITTVFNAAWNSIKRIFVPVINFFKEKFTGARDAIKAAFAAIGNWFKERYEDIKKVFAAVKDWFKEKFEGARNAIKNAFVSIATWFLNRYNDIKKVFATVKNFFRDKFVGAYEAVKSAFASIGKFFTDKYNQVKQVFANIKTWFGNIFKGAFNAIKGAFSGIGSWASGLWDTIVKRFTNIGVKIGDAIGGAFKSVVNGVLKTIEGVINKAVSFINGAIKVINKIPGVDIGTIDKVKLPRLAQGGYVEANTPQLAMIGDNRHQGEVVAPEDKMVDMIHTALKMNDAQKSGQGDPQFQEELLKLMKQIISILGSLDLTPVIDLYSLKGKLDSLEKRTGFSF